MPANVVDLRDVDSIPELGWFPGEGHDTPLQYSCLENPIDRGAWLQVWHDRSNWAHMHTLIFLLDRFIIT